MSPCEHTFPTSSRLCLVEEAHELLWKVNAKLLEDAYNLVTNKETKFTAGVKLLEELGKKDNIPMHNNDDTIQENDNIPIKENDNTPIQENDTDPMKEDGENVIPIQKMIKTVNRKKTKFDEVKLSKSMTFILRHGAPGLGISMDNGGIILVSDLLAKSNFSGVTLRDIEDIVNKNDKKRFELEKVNGKLMIRAVQGHSKELDEIIDETKLLDEIKEPLDKCIHGTDNSAWNIIKKKGLKSLSRMHIHFAISEPEDNNVISGMRQDTKVLIYVDMKKAMDDGIKFFISKNKVILSRGINGTIDPKYFEKVERR